MTTVTITALPEGTISDITYIPSETLGVTQRIAGLTLKNYITTTVAAASLTTLTASTITVSGATIGTADVDTVNATVLNALVIYAGNAQISSGNGAFTTLTATNFSTGNAKITGGNAAFTTTTTANFSSGNAQITGGNSVWTTATATNFSTGNARISGGNSAWTTLTSTNLSSGNAQITGGNAAWTTATATNFSTGNARISGAATYIGSSGTPIANIFAVSGSFSTLSTSANLTIGGNIIPTANATYDLGNATAWFGTFYGVSSQAKYADLAEKYSSDADYEPGTVMVFGTDVEVTISKTASDNKVAGVVTTNPAYLMNAESDGVAIALTGRVPCKVVGKISRGDMLVTSDVEGVATTSENPQIGQVIGKALANYDSDLIGTIEVVVGRL